MMNDNKKNNLRKKRGSYSISVVSEMFGVHQQTIRLYEKEGLITPNRSSGNTRKFTEEDVNQLEEVIYLTHKLGVNLAGVNIILKLKKKIKKMQDEMNSLFDKAKEGLETDASLMKIDAQTHVNKLLEIKKTKKNDNLGIVEDSLSQKFFETLDFDDDELDLDDE